MLVKDTEFINTSDNNLLNEMRRNHITTVEDMFRVPSIRKLPKDTMSSLQYEGVRDLFCYQYLGMIADCSMYLDHPIYCTKRDVGVEGVHIDFYFQYRSELQMSYILYRLGCNRRDTIIVMEAIQYFFEHQREPFTLEMVFEYLDSIKDKLIRKERDYCLFRKISLLLEMNKTLKSQKQEDPQK